MPLIKSKSDKAFKKNIATEVNAGKPVKQAVAIAYSTKRAVKKAAGGSTNPMNYDSDTDYYEARQKSMMGVPKAMRDAVKSINKDTRAQQDDYAAKQREWFAKSVAAAKAKKAAVPKCSGGKVRKQEGGKMPFQNVKGW